MSADLFAEFAAEPPSSQGQQSIGSTKLAIQPPPNFSFFDTLDTTPAPVTHAQQPLPQQHQPFQNFTASANAAVPSNDDNDDWGDFEGGSSTPAPAALAQQDPFAFTTTQAAPPQVPNYLPSNNPDPFAFGLGQSNPPSAHSWQRAPIIKAKRSADPSVLFDAEDDLDDDDDDDDDDDFGDFEGTDVKNDAPNPANGSSALVDLLGDMSVSQPLPPPVQDGEPIIRDRSSISVPTKRKSPVKAFRTETKPKQPAAKVPPPTAPKEDDAWDTFDDWEASIPTKALANTSSKRASVKATPSTESSATPAPIISPTTNDAQPGELPPTNVPPPGVLLSLFPSLFSDAQEKLFKPMAAQTLPMRNKLMAEPATIAYLQGYLMLGNVAAHIIAGRKLRWKRDQHLSQGMRIGPASSRATSGMKLTGIDKGENMKEEREASDVVRVWKDQVGRLRHVVSGVNQIKAGTLGLVPDLQETMPVKTLKQSEGGMPARQPCMMCGLKREERVTPADMGVDDSFGEWWVDQVNMHRGEFVTHLAWRDSELTDIQAAATSGTSTKTRCGSAEGNAPARVGTTRGESSSSATGILLAPNGDQRGTRIYPSQHYSIRNPVHKEIAPARCSWARRVCNVHMLLCRRFPTGSASI
jgi:hypothetical protein